MSSMRMKAIEGISVGDTFTTSRTFTEQQVMDFAKISRDYNPFHFDERFIKAMKFNRKICHGLLVASMVTEIGGQLGWLATEMDFKFQKPVYLGDTIKAELTVIDIDENGLATSEVVFTNQDGATVLEAVIKGFAPGEPGKQVMRAMITEGDPTNKI
ncbi:MAG: MaoC family dehydratase [Deltaproteobacteria bacterium]|nr:MaoC family dehydratase [Deltaproteobacteria bacterium]